MSTRVSSRVPSRGSTSTAPQIVPIDVDSIDDDVILVSPRTFAEAKNNSRRNRGGIVADLDAEDSSRRLNNCNMRNRVPGNQQVINCDSYVNLGSGTCNLRESGSQCKKQAAPPPPPEEPAFSCPVCMGPLVEEMSTKCGHIFCKTCIQAAISAQSKCPTCRRKVTMKDTLRVYLPMTRYESIFPDQD